MKNLIYHGQEIMDRKSWTGDNGQEIMDMKSWTGNHGQENWGKEWVVETNMDVENL